MGDEPVLIARHGHAGGGVQTQRSTSSHQAAGCNLIIADDGLQHCAGARRQIAVLDGKRVWAMAGACR
jgi:tetraacyldisaccharide-1-P 4'-kinase